MTDSPTSAAATPAGAQPQPEPPGQPAINLQQLADKVYDLLLADARLGRARGDSPLIAQRQGEG